MILSITDRENISQLSNGEIFGRFYYAEEIFRSLKRRIFWSFLLYRNNIYYIIQREYFVDIKLLRRFWSFSINRDNISKLLNCEVFGPFLSTEIIFRSYLTAKFMVFSIIYAEKIFRGY